MNIIYNIISIILIGACVVAGFSSQIPMAILYCLGSVAFLVIANLDNITKTPSINNDFDIETKELLEKAEATIVEMRNMAKLVSRTALSLIKRSGRFGGYPIEEQEALKDFYLRLLADLNLSEKEKDDVLVEYNRFIEIDYVLLLLQSRIPLNWPPDEQQIRQDMLHDILLRHPTAEQVEKLLERNGSLSRNHQDILDDYKYFHKYKRYRRPAMISQYKELSKTMNL